MFRFVNIDWLEVYALEDFNLYPCDAQFFRDRGWGVIEREYGTRVYRQMFTLLDVHDEPLFEIRREPFSTKALDGGLFPRESCHIRLHNRTCYFANPVATLREFMTRYNYELRKIYRIDICCDFERFDGGDEPAAFVERYMKGRYAKVNQTNISAHGSDMWNGRVWNSLSWGKPKSMVGTKLYCKTMELEQQHDKPYIWYSWMGDNEHAGLIDDPINHTKRSKDGSIYKPAIWRLEFSIKSSAQKVFVMEKGKGKASRIEMPHTLDMYDNRIKLLTMFASLQLHYFHFKHYEVDKRKDKCKDKVLFKFSPMDTFYKIDRLASHVSTARPAERFLSLVRNYRLTHNYGEVAKACDVLINDIEAEIARGSMTSDSTMEDVLLLRRLIATRIDNPQGNIVEQKATLKNLLSLFEDTIY